MRADRRAGRSALGRVRGGSAGAQRARAAGMDYLIAAIAEDHDAALHYDPDFDRLAMHTDLAIAVEPPAELGSLP